MVAVAVPVEDRYWARVDMSGGPDACWPWTAARNDGGYGVFGVSPTDVRLAHRYGAELDGREVPAACEVMHTCDNPPCQNPTHLVVGTKAENMADMARKGCHWARRRPSLVLRGERHGRSKLTEGSVAVIRDSSASTALLAARFGITAGHVRAVRRGDSWAR